MSDKSHTLESASEAFGVDFVKRNVEHGVALTAEYIEYCREDVDATARLFEASMTEYLRHPITPLRATNAFSAASLGKAHLEALGINTRRKLQPDFDRQFLGAGMVAYYGGRTEARIRDVPVPVRHLDFVSMYPTGCARMRVWRLATARRIVTRDATRRVQRLLERVTVEDCLAPALWERLTCLVRFAPENDVLPVRSLHPLGVRRAHTLTGYPRALRPPTRTRSVTPPSPTSTRQPARRHPLRLPPPPHHLRRKIAWAHTPTPAT